MNKLFLFDIEGTTTDINFVHNVLFPYSRKKLENFIHQNSADLKIQSLLKDTQQTIIEEQGKEASIHQIISTLIYWIDSDRKHPALKELQGLIWEFGYKNNDFKGHLYEDTYSFFKMIHKSQFKIAIYSSGSVWAQKLLFQYSDFGDLTSYISKYFDTKVGGKRERTSYEKIALESGFKPSEIYFFSDINAELEAAFLAGFNCIQLKRYPVLEGKFQIITNFNEFIF